MEFPTSPFYQWLDHERIRAVLHDVAALRPGERLVLLKGLVPGLVDAQGAKDAESFLAALATKARRYEEARSHPGEGRLHRETPGEQLGGPIPDGHRQVAETRNPDRRGVQLQHRISGASWLHLSMNCLCSITLSSSCSAPGAKVASARALEPLEDGFESPLAFREGVLHFPSVRRCCLPSQARKIDVQRFLESGVFIVGERERHRVFLPVEVI
jgi:hypothetical protein